MYLKTEQNCLVFGTCFRKLNNFDQFSKQSCLKMENLSNFILFTIKLYNEVIDVILNKVWKNVSLLLYLTLNDIQSKWDMRRDDLDFDKHAPFFGAHFFIFLKYYQIEWFWRQMTNFDENFFHVKTLSIIMILLVLDVSNLIITRSNKKYFHCFSSKLNIHVQKTEQHCLVFRTLCPKSEQVFRKLNRTVQFSEHFSLSNLLLSTVHLIHYCTKSRDFTHAPWNQSKF